MTLKEKFLNIKIEDIKAFVENKDSEDLFLEFKIANFPNQKDADLKNFSKCLSGFANSSGGILVWGVEAKKNQNNVDAAQSLKPIKEFIRFENFLKKNEQNCIIPTITGIEYRKVESDLNEGFVLVYIPPSERAPHMALYADKHYYKRSADNFYMCEHFDIMDILQRKTFTRLKVQLKNEAIMINGSYPGAGDKYESIFCIENIGQVSAKYIFVYLKVNTPFQISNFGIDGNRSKGMNSLPTKDNFRKYSGGSDIVIHPGMDYEVDKITLNEIGGGSNIQDLIVEYKIMAEGMVLLAGEITRTKEELMSSERM